MRVGVVLFELDGDVALLAHAPPAGTPSGRPGRWTNPSRQGRPSSRTWHWPYPGTTGASLPFESSHIDPVRSTTNITSSGTALHGEHAVACTLIGIVLMPISRRNVVARWPFRRPPPCLLQRSWAGTSSTWSGRPRRRWGRRGSSSSSRSARCSVRGRVRGTRIGKRAAPASDAASADACSWMRVRYACPRSMTRPANSRMQTMKTMTRGRVWPSSRCGVRCAKGELLLPSGQAARAGAT